MSFAPQQLVAQTQGYYAEVPRSGQSHGSRKLAAACLVVACITFGLATSSRANLYQAQSIAQARPQALVIPPETRMSTWRAAQGPKAVVPEVTGIVSTQAEGKATFISGPMGPLKWMLVAFVSAAILPIVHFLKRASSQSQFEGDEEDLEEEASWALAATIGVEILPQPTVEIPVKDAAGSSVGVSELCLKTAGVNSRFVIHRKLVAEMANKRQSNAHTKTRAEVSGGGKKPYKQKGTGNARRGSTRSPLMRHGGVAFGPRNTKNYKQKINRKEGQLALSSLIQNRAPLITVIKDLEDSVKVVSTKKMAELVESWKDPSKGDKVLIVIDVDGKWPTAHPLVLSTANIPLVRLINQRILSVTELLWPHQIFISEKAMESLKARFEVPEGDEEEAEASAASATA